MWYEILPSFCIITAALGLPGWGLYHCHNLILGNHYRRSLIDRWDRHSYQRDVRLTGNPYNVAVGVARSEIICFTKTKNGFDRNKDYNDILKGLTRFQITRGRK